MKLWQKNTDSLREVEQFTVGNDRYFDTMMARQDVLGNMAHAIMLSEIGLLTKEECRRLLDELKKIYNQVESGSFSIADGVEDVHSQVELLLTEKLGDTGKKIHAARSRNDQVLVDLKLFLRDQVQELVEAVTPFFHLLQQLSETHKDKLLPGYTHLQLAMPSSFGLWFGAYAESLVDDLTTLQAAYTVVNKNPLGSAAGYGSSFPIKRLRTTELLGFAALNNNVVYAQMGRGKAERIVAMSLANIADTLGKLSMDACLFLNQNFGFISFPPELTTGSSIMPHKKNPDVFELIRAKCNQLKAIPNEIMLLTTNLPSGYHRDLQLLKEHLFPAFGTLKSCLQMVTLMLEHIEIKNDILKDDQYKYLFSVEAVNELVLQGMPFRDAYKAVGLSIESGIFHPVQQLSHTHEGSIGNLRNKEVAAAYADVVAGFGFEPVQQAISGLLKQ
ncbi:MAG: argininosuccinate lyase [Flavihumibacter sp.]